MVDEIPAAALAASAVDLDHGSDDYWALVDALQRRGGRATFELAAGLATSADVRTRTVGLDVLGQLGVDEGHPFLEETLPIAEAAALDAEPLVAAAAVTALGHLADERALPTVLRLRGHDDHQVRLAVVVALAFVAGEPPADDAVAALIELTADPVADVRDWATFELGAVLEVDGPQVREALAARLDDRDGDTAGEALVGLARRDDKRALDPVLRLLERPDCGNLVVEAAGAIGSPVLLAPLRRLKAIGWELDDPRGHVLDEAIAACADGA